MPCMKVLIAVFVLLFASPVYADQLVGEGVVLRIDGGPNPRTEYYIKHKGKHTLLELKGHQRWTSGAKIAVNGSWRGKSFKVDSLEVEPVIEELETGPKNAIVIVVNMGSGTFSQSSVNSVVSTLGQMDELYQESSYGTTSFPLPQGVLVDIGSPVDNCDVFTIADHADSLVGDLAGIHNKVYWVPPESISGCSWLAVGEVGGFGRDDVRKSWTTRNSLSAIGHEVGHNKGWHHASTDPDNNGVKNSEYGDTSSIMGYCCVAKRLNSYQVVRIGWNLPTDILVSGEYVIPHLYSNDIGTVLRFPRPAGDDYYLSYRKAEGYDSSLSSGYRTGVAIHYGRLTGNRSLYIDTLSDGETFVDGDIGVTQISHTADATTVFIDFGFITPPPPPPPPEPICGNGLVEEGEQCDDGNLFNGDGCDEFCQIELDECQVKGKPTMECWCKVRPNHWKCQ